MPSRYDKNPNGGAPFVAEARRTTPSLMTTTSMDYGESSADAPLPPTIGATIVVVEG
jgi:hypothetical protein